jgi:hypothetical protein
MDFSKFDNRAPAETGIAMPLLDPVTREPLASNGKPCAVLVRGVASRVIQQQIREKARAKMAATPNDDAQIACMEDLHEAMIDGAAPFIAGFVNVERNGQPLTTSADDVRWFLDLTFPIMEPKKDADGNAVIVDGVPQFEMVNLPFAKQIDNFAADQRNFLGNAKSA